MYFADAVSWCGLETPKHDVCIPQIHRILRRAGNGFQGAKPCLENRPSIELAHDIFVVPTFSFIYLLWIWYLLSSDANTPLTPSQHPTPPHLFSFVWSLRFIIWFAVLCMSLSHGLDYTTNSQRICGVFRRSRWPKRTGYANQEKIFIAAVFFNNEKVIPYWSDSILKAIRYLGADNVFVSILESESTDKSPELLQQLDEKLDVMEVQRHTFKLTRDKTVTKPDDSDNRTYFLTTLQNHVLEPLVENGGYDKPETIIELINTADGEYDMACGIDFNGYGLYEDSMIRDQRGSRSFTRSVDGSLPLPDTHPSANDTALHALSPASRPPVRFRTSSWRECYSSECFLPPYDFRRVFNMNRIFVNPRVIIAYEWRFYAYFKWFIGNPDLISQWDGGDCRPFRTNRATDEPGQN
ncbi:Cryptococcal mannosyltransferase 1 domain containing protein [Tylopilus felleus]